MLILTMLLATATPVLGASQADVKALFEAGNYQQVIQTIDAGAPDVAGDPGSLFLKALSHVKLSQNPAAAQVYAAIGAGRGDGDAWRWVGEAGRLLAEGQVDPALSAANRAVEVGGGLAQAHYQRGLVLGHAQNFAAAAEAFARAAQIDPGFAYSHYHAGISFYRAQRIDLMATHFERFLQLAPNAPERGEVESIMRTVRGRR